MKTSSKHVDLCHSTGHGNFSDDSGDPVSGNQFVDAGLYDRFLAIASIIRTLHARYKAEGKAACGAPIQNLRSRLGLIRKMQSYGILSLIGCISSVVTLFFEWSRCGEFLFGLSLF